MRAWFKRAVQRRSTGSFSRSCQREDLGMRTAILLVPALGDQLPSFVNDHRTDRRVRLDSAQPPLRQLKGVTHRSFGSE